MNRTECNTIPILDNTLQYGKWQTRRGQNTNSKLFTISMQWASTANISALNDLDKLRNAESNALDSTWQRACGRHVSDAEDPDIHDIHEAPVKLCLGRA